MLSPTVVCSAERLDTSARAHQHNSAALRLRFHVMESQTRGVDNAFQHDINSFTVRLLRITTSIGLELQVVGARTNASIGEDIIDMAVDFDSLFEEGNQFGPVRHVGLEECETRGRLGRVVQVSRNNRGAEREQEVDRCEADS